MNYWFLYRSDSGTIHGAPYLGEAEEWTNIPEGCGVIGPIPQSDNIAKDASENPDWYTVQNDILAPVSDIVERRAGKEAAPKPPDPDVELANAIAAAVTVDDLKKALLGSNGKLARVKGKMK